MKPSDPAVIVLCAFDVVLSEVISTLDFNDNDVLRPGVRDSVPCALGNIHCLAVFQMGLIFIDGHDGAPLDNVPVFPSAQVPLETQALFRENNNAFHFVVRLIGKD